MNVERTGERLSTEEFDGIRKRAQAINAGEEVEPLFKWAHRVDQWHFNDLPRLLAGFEAEHSFAKRAEQMEEALHKIAEFDPVKHFDKPGNPGTPFNVVRNIARRALASSVEVREEA